MKRIFAVSAFAFALSLLSFGQGEPSRAPGVAFATAYNHWSVRVATGNTATGTQTITLQQGYVQLPDGRTIVPFNINAPLLVDAGNANSETVTPTAVSGCGAQAPPGGLPTCNITATFANVHGPGAVVMSGSFGLQEALDDCIKPFQGTGCNAVVIDTSFSGTNATIGSATATICGTVAPVALVEDRRTWPFIYWACRPTTLTNLSAPSAPTLAVASGGSLSTGSGGTYFLTITYVDPLGGETLASTAGSQQTVTIGNQTITVTAPAASAGAVGYRVYITAAGGADGTEVLGAPTCSTSTLTWLPNTCALLAPTGLANNASITTNPASTNAIEPTSTAPGGQNTAHTAFALQPFHTLPAANFQTVWGPFATRATEAAGTTYNEAVVQVPANYFSFLNEKYRVCATFVGTGASTSTVPVFKLQATNQLVNGTTNSLATYTFTAITAASWNFRGCTDINIAAAGTSGTAQVHGTIVGSPSAGGGTTQVAQDANTASAVSFANLTQPIWLIFASAPTGANITNATVSDLSIEPVSAN